MRRADRLFQIVQLMRRKRLVTAAQLAERLEVSERTVYRDIRDLGRSGVVITGEAGVGYRLERGAELPPLTFNREELEALVLGVRMVESWGDAPLRASARAIVDKIESVLPVSEQPKLRASALFAMSAPAPEAALRNLTRLRRATAEQLKVKFAYEDKSARASERVIRPLGLYFWTDTWIVGSWCELRRDFRNFRLDRMKGLSVSKERFEHEPPVTLQDFVAAMTKDRR